MRSPARHDDAGGRRDGDAGPAVGSGAAHVRAAAAAHDPVPVAAPAARPSVVDRVKALLAWWKQTRVARANARFGARGGGVLTGGIAYATLFSVFAGLTLGYTVLMAVLGGNEELRDRILDAVDSSLPGLVDTGDGNGLLDPDELQLTTGLTVAGAVALVILLLSAVAAVAALRTAVRAMFTTEGAGNALVGKVRELGGFAGLGFALVLSAVLGTVVSSAATWVLDALGWEGVTTVLLRVLAVLVTFVVDATIFVLVVKFLAGQNPAWRDLRQGALIAATGIGVVRYLGTAVVGGSIQRNPLLASFTVVVTLLLWVNLVARITLLAAAWTADPPLEEPAEAD